MATAPAVLNRTREESSLKAYGRIQGGVEQKDMTEEQKALAFNARISENYQRLINPDLNKAEEIAAPVYEASAARSYEAPVAQAPVFAEPVRQEAPAYEQRRVADVFRADSPINTRTVNFEQAAPVREYEQEVPYYEEQQGYAEDAMNADLMPTETTTQYRDNLYREEQRVTAVEEKKPRTALSARSKLMIMIYSIVVVVILALIIVNTSVLNTLDGEVAMREAELRNAMDVQQSIEDEIDYYTDSATIIDRAENELGMYLPGEAA